MLVALILNVFYLYGYKSVNTKYLYINQKIKTNNVAKLIKQNVLVKYKLFSQ